MKTSRTLLIIPLLIAASCAAVTLDTTGRGWYDSTGYASSGDSYQTGAASQELRSWFSFDLGAVTRPIASAQISLFEPVAGFSSTLNGSETFQLYDVSTTGLANDPTFSADARPDIFADLGSGTLLGSVSLSSANDNSTVTFALSASGISYLNAHLGTRVTFGGALLGVSDGTNDTRFVFNASNSGNAADGRTTLQITAVPEPSAWAAFGVSSVLFAAVSRRKRRAV